MASMPASSVRIATPGRVLLIVNSLVALASSPLAVDRTSLPCRFTAERCAFTLSASDFAAGARSADPSPLSWTNTLCAPRFVRSMPCSLVRVGVLIDLCETGAFCAGPGSAAEAAEPKPRAVAAAVERASTAMPTRPVRDGNTRDSFSPGKGTAGRTAAERVAQPEMCGGSQQLRHHNPETAQTGASRAVGI